MRNREDKVIGLSLAPPPEFFESTIVARAESSAWWGHRFCGSLLGVLVVLIVVTFANSASAQCPAGRYIPDPDGDGIFHDENGEVPRTDNFYDIKGFSRPLRCRT